jgi:preprotein translocase subunit SecG
MVTIFIILIVLICAILGFLVLIQSPKGGGLASNVGGVGNNLMGVKQTNDVLEKGTWIFVGLLAVLCLFASIFIGKIEVAKAPKPAPTEKAAK